ncbi:hypothetical protein [Gordonia aichiensis]
MYTSVASVTNFRPAASPAEANSPCRLDDARAVWIISPVTAPEISVNIATH